MKKQKELRLEAIYDDLGNYEIEVGYPDNDCTHVERKVADVTNDFLKAVVDIYNGTESVIAVYTHANSPIKYYMISVKELTPEQAKKTFVVPNFNWKRG